MNAKTLPRNQEISAQLIMSEPLLPERHVQFSPSLATVIGVEEAILLQHILTLGELSPCDKSGLPRQLKSKTYAWIQTSLQGLSLQLPFWQASAVRRILQNLNDLGMVSLSIVPQSAEQAFFCAVMQNQLSSREEPAVESPQKALGAHKISARWQPDTATLAHLDNLGVPREFSQQAIGEFILYWSERNEVSHAWGSKFAQHVARRWQSEQQLLADRKRREKEKQDRQTRSEQSTLAMQDGWQPNIDAVEILERMGIHKNFIVDAIPEFVLYWQERGEPQATWNSKFVAHTKRQWARFTNALRHDTEPRPISDQWRPDEEVFEVLSLANIQRDFAESLIPEFVMYWRDRGELHHSWNTKFLQYVKYQWSRQYRENHSTYSVNANSNDNNRPTSRPRKTRDRSLAEDLFDRSWAN